MKNWDTLEPDKVRLMNKHFTRGRGGKKIDMVVIHHMAGIGDADQCWNWWQARQASAHYAVSPTGEIGQLVWDRDTAWHAANLDANQRSIGIEHSNSAGAGADWPINDVTLEEGAHLVAAICKFFNLGRPEWGKNVRTHADFFATSCGYHLRPGWKYNARYMERAQYWFDQMTNPKPVAPAPTEKDDFMSALTPDEQRDFYTKVKELHNAFLSPVPSLVEGSSFQAPRVDMIDLLDRKVEELHVKTFSEQSDTQRECEGQARLDEEHDPAAEEHHEVEEADQ